MRKITARSTSEAVKVLNANTINPNLIKAEYAVRGYIPTLANKISQQLKLEPQKYDFDEIVQLNIGNPLIFNTKPIWTFRQMIGAYLQMNQENFSSALIKHSTSYEYMKQMASDIEDEQLFQDFNKVAMWLNKNQPSLERTTCGGYMVAKKAIADMIEKRDGYPSDPNKIFLSNGASSVIRLFFDYLITSPDIGILIPIPQYPLYSALITLFNGKGVPYYLDEENCWNITLTEVVKAYDNAIKDGIKPRAIVLINPGNPTGNVFDRSSMDQIVEFAHRKNLVLLADEVYQENIYSNKKWYSFKKVVAEAPSNIAKEVELVSFHSLSKGILGECGIRGGYVEMTNMDPGFTEEFEKNYAMIWPNTVGQAIMTLKCKYLSGQLKQEISQSSYNILDKEYQKTSESLRFRAQTATQKLNEALNVKCNPIEGAMYAFPQIKLSNTFIKAAEKAKLKPDVLYCKLILEKTGICLVPGSGFGQKEGTFHFRTTILPSPDDYFMKVFERLISVNNQLMNEYA